jgi:hypothetical protein
MPNCWLAGSLHPANSTKNYPWFSSVPEQVGAQILGCTACFTCSRPPSVSIKFCSASALPAIRSKAPVPILSSAHISPLPNHLPYIDCTFTSRMSGCCTETNKARGIFSPPPSKCSLSRYSRLYFVFSRSWSKY